MVLDTLENADRYVSLHPAFERAFRYLKETDLAVLEPGKYEIDGTNLFALISDGTGIAPEEAQLEVHRTYLDIQYIITGTDHMGWKPLHDCRNVTMEYDETKDAALYREADVKTWFDVPAGAFTIFYPTDAHAPMSTTQQVKKAVLKIRIEQ